MKIAQKGENLSVRITGFGSLTVMEHEVRISYLCTKAATGSLTLDEESELLGYIALDPIVFQMILMEDFLSISKRKKREL